MGEYILWSGGGRGIIALCGRPYGLLFTLLLSGRGTGVYLADSGPLRAKTTSITVKEQSLAIKLCAGSFAPCTLVYSRKAHSLYLVLHCAAQGHLNWFVLAPVPVLSLTCSLTGACCACCAPSPPCPSSRLSTRWWSPQLHAAAWSSVGQVTGHNLCNMLGKTWILEVGLMHGS
jgi:hypothetical protein